jgi:hypothetical protein
MQALRLWSFSKVLLVSGGWIFLCVLLTAAWLAFQFRGLWAASSTGSGGIGAVSVGLNAITLVIPFGPPIVLILAWLVARWS